MNARVFSFKDQLVISTGTSANPAIGAVLLDVMPGALRAMQALEVNDRQGIDWWLEMKSGERVGIDCKVREDDPKPRFGKDDLALETWSVVEKKIIGWTLDETKRTDYVLWLWKDTGRWCVVPFRLLVRAFKAKKDEWCRLYKVARQSTEGRYQSECVFVDRAEVFREIYRQSNGHSASLKIERADQLSLLTDLGAAA